LLAGLTGQADAKTVWLDEAQIRSRMIQVAVAEPVQEPKNETEELAQGDAEEAPVDFSLTPEEMELTEAASVMPVQKEVVEDEKIPTLTAEGGFLLPTYVLPEAQEVQEVERTALVDEKNPWREAAVSSTKANVPTAPVVLSKPTATMKKSSAPLKTVIIEGTKDSVPTHAKEEVELLNTLSDQYQNTNELLASATEKLRALEREQESLRKAQALQRVEEEKKKNRGPLLLPLPEKRKVLPPVEEADPEPYMPPRQVTENGYVDHVLSVLERKSSAPVYHTASDETVLKSIPTELKISFMPASADLSSQSLKWIRAFSYHPKKSVNNIVEIRLSPNNLELQSRRFALIKGALESSGLNSRQIRFVLTDRNPDTIVLRTVALPEDSEVFYRKGKDGKTASQIIQKW
jgi:hypothetical protein